MHLNTEHRAIFRFSSLLHPERSHNSASAFAILSLCSNEEFGGNSAFMAQFLTFYMLTVSK